MILLIDNYDSFVYNLARYFQRLGQETLVVRNDAINACEVRARRPDAIVISPGPCTPNEAGSSLEIVRRLADEIPILGVCLGHQTVAAALGGTIVRAEQPMHGRTSQVYHNGDDLFDGIVNPMTVCRYHSLVVNEDALPNCFSVTARSDDAIMAIRHKERPVIGVQFHPESILTDAGYSLLANFLRIAGIDIRSDAAFSTELRVHQKPNTIIPAQPVTF
jgi:anthranilate synthase/aminodeoxychorismate synthase-like glutamine amidotransferase